MRIHVRIYTGHTAPLQGRRKLAEKCISLEVSPDDTVLTVKALLQQSVHVTPNDQRLFLHGLLLENLSTLAECNVVMDAELHMEINFQIQINVRTWDNRSLRMDVLVIDRVRAIKTMLVQYTRLAVYQQILQFDCSVMQDDFTLQDYNVRHDDVVIQITNTELLDSVDSQLIERAPEQQSKLDNIQLVFPRDLRICRVCSVPAYFQRGWCFNIHCECKGKPSALSQQWLAEKQQQAQQSHSLTLQFVLPPFGIRQCSTCCQWTYLRKGWCCNVNCCRKR
jgi:hypothetical protein